MIAGANNVGDITQKSRNRSKHWFRDLIGGSERRRSADLTIFSRSLYQLSYRAVNNQKPGVPGFRPFERLRPDLNR